MEDNELCSGNTTRSQVYLLSPEDMLQQSLYLHGCGAALNHQLSLRFSHVAYTLQEFIAAGNRPLLMMEASPCSQCYYSTLNHVAGGRLIKKQTLILVFGFFEQSWLLNCNNIPRIIMHRLRKFEWNCQKYLKQLIKRFATIINSARFWTIKVD